MAKNQPKKPSIAPKAPQATAKNTVSNKQKTSTSSSWFKLSSGNEPLLFDKQNYIILGIGALLIILGFILMSGGNTDPKVFNEAEIYSTRRITIAPITIIAGFLVIVVAILKKPSTVNNSTSTEL